MPQNPPTICPPPPSLPSYLTSRSTGTGSAPHVTKPKPPAQDNSGAKKKAADLHKEVLDSEPGSAQ